MAFRLSANCIGYLLVLVPAHAANWAVIVAGSNGYENYRHQADACHAYQIVKSKGIPEDNIIMMSYDDVADDEENPFRGKLFNKPDKDGPGHDVYAGCKIDYSKREVTAKNFIAVLTGTASGKSLKSTSDDLVFINFVDHGAPGLIAFPSTEVHKKQLQAALSKMAEKKMFKKLVFYLESCESGSMFKGMDIPGVYALSAANAKESSWGTYCSGKQDVVNGKNLHTCLGDLFSVNWMQDIDAQSGPSESLETQFRNVKKLTNKSHVMQWGDLSFTSDTIDSFLGGANLPAPAKPADTAQSTVDSRHADLFRFYDMYTHEDTSSTRVAVAARMQAELKKQDAAEQVYRKIASLAYPGDESKQQWVRRYQAEPDYPDCELAAHASIRQNCADLFNANSGFALQFHQVVVNICEDIAQGLNFDLAGASAQVCSSFSETLVV
jgi:legumain